MISGKAKLAGVIGDPVGHSLSPRLHGYWLAKHGVDGAYIPMHVEPNNLEQALRALPALGFQGVNLTLPHKEQALCIVDEVSEIATRIGAVNTIIVKDKKLHGTNTDGDGFMANLRYHIDDLCAYLDHVMIVGAGGASKSIAVALADAGAKQMTITNRSIDKADALAESVGAAVCAWEEKDAALKDVTLLVNTTSLGMVGQPPLELSLGALHSDALVTDAIYHPLMTPLLSDAEVRGNKVVTGIGMLIHQAAPCFESWFGVKPVVDNEAYSLLEGHL